MAENIDIHIKNLQSKLQLLLKKYALLQKENDQLEKENVNMNLKVKSLHEKNARLEMQLNILKTSAGQLEGKEKSDFEKSINSYIRTLDKCISILNK
jgi:chromosome segregation ATPase